MKTRPHFLALTPKRGKKAPPKSKPGAWDRPPLEASHTKSGPGRKAHASASNAPRTMVAPPPLKKLKANVGHRRISVLLPDGSRTLGAQRRVWREGEPVHIVKPVHVARIAEAKRQAEAA